MNEIELSERQLQILKLLVTKVGKVSSSSLAEIYEVSSRTIRYDLDAIEYKLSRQGLNLERCRTNGIIVGGNREQLLGLFKQLSSSKLTFPYEIAMEFLLNHTVTLMGLANNYLVSKNKVIQALPEVEQILLNADLRFEKRPSVGMSLQGSENQIRMAIFKMSQFTDQDLEGYFLAQLPEETLNLIKAIIKKYQALTKIQFSDSGVKELILSLSYQQWRLSQGYAISYSYDETKRAVLSQELETILGCFQSRGINLPIEEGVFILNQIRNTKVISLPEPKINKIINPDSYELVTKFIKLTRERLGIDLDWNESALQIHLNVALHRLKTGQVIQNPLTEQIQYRYRYIFETVKKIMLELEQDYGLSFPEDEIAYLTMHVGACFEMSEQVVYMPRVWVICNSGLATSTLLVTRLKVMLPEMKILGSIGVSELTDELAAQGDFMISTIEFEMAGKEVVVVNPLLDIEDVVQLKKRIFTLTSQKQLTHLVEKGDKTGGLTLKNLVPKARIQLKQQVESWRQAIRLAAEPLIAAEFVKKSYVDAMIQAVEELGPYMVFIPSIALIHASPKSGVIKEGISILTLKEPLNLGDKKGVPVSCFIVLGTLKKECQLFLNLMQILENQENVQLLLESSSIENVLQLSNRKECHKDELAKD